MKRADNSARKGLPGLSAQFLAAAERGDFETLTSLFCDGANPNACDEHGNNALHIAARNGFELTLKTLLDLGTNPVKLNSKNETPLMIAARQRQGDCGIRLLVPVSGDLKQRNADGQTALMLAEKSGNLSSIRSLRAELRKQSADSPDALDPVLQRDIRIMRPLKIQKFR